MKPGTPPLKSARLLDQMRERIRYLHYSLSTEKVYLYWVRFFIRRHGRAGKMQHPRDIGAPGVEAFLTMLAKDRRVSAARWMRSVAWCDGGPLPQRSGRSGAQLERQQRAQIRHAWESDASIALAIDAQFRLAASPRLYRPSAAAVLLQSLKQLQSRIAASFFTLTAATGELEMPIWHFTSSDSSGVSCSMKSAGTRTVAAFLFFRRHTQRDQKTRDHVVGRDRAG